MGDGDAERRGSVRGRVRAGATQGRPPARDGQAPPAGSETPDGPVHALVLSARARPRNPAGAGGVCSRPSTRSAPRTTGVSGASPSWRRSADRSPSPAGRWPRRSRCSRSSSTRPIFEPRPYSPASRLFWNELSSTCRAPGAPGVAGGPRRARRPRSFGEHRASCGGASSSITGARWRPNAACSSRSRSAVRSPPPGFREFRTHPAAARLREVPRGGGATGTWWGAWPAVSARASSPGQAEDDPVGRLHLYAQWAGRRQLGGRGRIGRRADARPPDRRERRGLRRLARTGSFPPDVDPAPRRTVLHRGQDWGLRPLHPHGIRQAGYRYPTKSSARCCVRAFLRIDHVIGLHRLYWVPRGASARRCLPALPAPGVVRVVVDRRERSQAVVAGEDLGTVPGYVRPAMKRTGSCGPTSRGGRATPASRSRPRSRSPRLNTHDMPTWAGFWRGTDVPLDEELGLIDRDQAERFLEGATRGARSAPRVAPRAPRRPRRRGPARIAGSFARTARRQVGPRS